MSEEASTVGSNSSEKALSSECEDHEPTLEDHANKVLHTILRKYPDLTVIISSTEGKCITSTLCKKQALESSSCLLDFTDKAKILMGKVLNEELSYVRIRGKTNEIVITFDDLLEIITIQDDKIET